MKKIQQKSKYLIVTVLYKIVSFFNDLFTNKHFLKIKIALGVLLISSQTSLKAQNDPNQTDVIRLDAQLEPDDVVMCYVIVQVNPNYIKIGSELNIYENNPFLSFELKYEHFYRNFSFGATAEITTPNSHFHGILIAPEFKRHIRFGIYGGLYYQYGVYSIDNEKYFTDFHNAGIEIEWKRRVYRDFGFYANGFFESTVSSIPEFNYGGGAGIYYVFY